MSELILETFFQKLKSAEFENFFTWRSLAVIRSLLSQTFASFLLSTLPFFLLESIFCTKIDCRKLLVPDEERKVFLGQNASPFFGRIGK